MVVCSICGTDNTTDSKFCKNCAASLTPTQTTAPSVAPPPPPKDFSQQMPEVGKKFGEAMGQMGERFGKEAERAAKEFGNWWDKALGILSPVITGLFGVVILLVLVLIADSIATVSDHPGFWRESVDFAWDYIWLLVGLIFLGSFQNYFHRGHRSTFRWVNPLVSGVGFAAWFWIFAQVLKIAGRNSDHPRLGDLGEFVEDVLLVIFFLVVVTGYLILWFSLVSPANWDKKQQAR